MTLRARKRFGQNFLTDGNVIRRLVDAIRPLASDRIIEIGPGHGALTAPLVSASGDLEVIEIDRDLVRELHTRFPDLVIHEADVLKLDLAKIVTPGTRVVGNLPYNISTPLLFRLFPLTGQIRDMHFMLQLEVVDRLTAEPSSPAYGRLSVMAGYWCRAEKLFEVPPGAFTPAPKVTSAIVRLTPANHGEEARDVGVLGDVVTRAFNQRRKTIRNGLKGLVSEESLRELDIDPQLRPENLSLADYVRCANHLVAS